MKHSRNIIGIDDFHPRFANDGIRRNALTPLFTADRSFAPARRARMSLKNVHGPAEERRVGGGIEARLAANLLLLGNRRIRRSKTALCLLQLSFDRCCGL